MFTKNEEAANLARGGSLGSSVAELELRHNDIYIAMTNERTGHIDVWAPPRRLLNCVVGCVDLGVS